MLGVAPHWGAWIEIEKEWKRIGPCRVAPHWGAWIEIIPLLYLTGYTSRTPLGCVDVLLQCLFDRFGSVFP